MAGSVVSSVAVDIAVNVTSIGYISVAGSANKCVASSLTDSVASSVDGSVYLVLWLVVYLVV